MKKLFLILGFLFASILGALAQNVTCATRPPGDNSNACASTAFVHNSTNSGLPLATPEQIYIGTGTAGQAAASSVLPNETFTPALQISVKQYGALGNSNGTHGNGADDTAAINTAINTAPNGAVYFPCGIYRITGPIVGSTVLADYNLQGSGQCSKIYLDNSNSTAAAMEFSSVGSSCVSCVTIQGLNFIIPNMPDATVAVTLNNELNSVFENNYITGYNVVEALTTSYGPEIINNFYDAIGTSIVSTTGDVSLNGAKFWRNKVFNSGIFGSSAALTLDCTNSGVQANISIIGNDIEHNYAGIEFLGCNSVSLLDNYIETETVYDFNFSDGTTNNSYDIRGNWFGSEPDTVMGPVTKATFSANTFYGFNLTWKSTALGVIFEPTNSLLGGATIGALPTPTVSACGGGTPSLLAGSTRLRGQVFEGTSAAGCSVTFELAFDTTPFCTWFGNTVAALQATALSTTGFSVTNTSASGGSFFYDCTSTH